MIKKVTSILFAVIFAGSISHAGLVDWSAGDAMGDPVAATFQTGWLVAIYQDVNEDNSGSGSWFNELRLDNSGVVTSLGLTADDVFLGFTTTVMAPGSFVTITPSDFGPSGLADNIDVYSVVFDAADMGSALNFVVTDLSPFDVGAVQAPNTPVQYFAFGDSIAGDYQAIPEPTVAAFIGVFGGGMLIARRLFSKQA